MDKQQVSVFATDESLHRGARPPELASGWARGASSKFLFPHILPYFAAGNCSRN